MCVPLPPPIKKILYATLSHIICLYFILTAQYPDSPGRSALTSHADKLRWKLLTQFSAFFSRFLTSYIHHGSQPDQSPGAGVGSGSRQNVSDSVGKCFVSGCHLLCLLAQIPLSLSLPADSKGVCLYTTDYRNFLDHRLMYNPM